MEILHNQGIFPQSREFSTIKDFFYSRGNFPQTKIFTQSKKNSANKDQKGSLKTKVLDPFNTKSCGKIFLAL